MYRERERIQHEAGGISKTKQSDQDSADINSIMRRWIAHGEVPLNNASPQYGDFSNATDYKTACDKIQLAQEQFDALPASVRAHVDNDPGKFLDMIYDPERTGELEELGLVEGHIPEQGVKTPKRIPENETDPEPKPEPDPEI